MIDFAYIDARGYPTGGGIRPTLPDGAVPLSEPFSTADLPRLRFRDGAWEARTDLPEAKPPTAAQIAANAAETLDRSRQVAVNRINARAGDIRKRIYTDIPGQDALYLEKRAEALAYVAEALGSAEPTSLHDYPLLENETGVTAQTPWQLAQIWLFRADQFKRVGATTEQHRMRALIAIAAAPDLTTLETIERDFIEAMSRLIL